MATNATIARLEQEHDDAAAECRRMAANMSDPPTDRELSAMKAATNYELQLGTD